MNERLRSYLLRLAPVLIAATLSAPAPARAAGTGLYVALAGGGSIEGFNTATGAGVTVATGLSGPNGIAFDASNDLFHGNQTGYEIDEIAVGGARSVVTNSTLHAEQLAFSPSGMLYANDQNGIERVNAGGMLTTVGGSGGTYGFGLAIDAAGNLYSTGTGGTTVLRYPAGGGGSTVFATGLNGPSGLAFDAAGNLYVANEGTNTVLKVPAAGGAATTFASAGLNDPVGLAFDAAGDLYVSNFGSGTIERFDASGGNATVFASGLNGPEFLAFGPAVVPEPSAWVALTCGGMASLLAARRTRRQSA